MLDFVSPSDPVCKARRAVALLTVLGVAACADPAAGPAPSDTDGPQASSSEGEVPEVTGPVGSTGGPTDTTAADESGSGGPEPEG